MTVVGVKDIVGARFIAPKKTQRKLFEYLLDLPALLKENPINCLLTVY
jgi:hypothetical protein